MPHSTAFGGDSSKNILDAIAWMTSKAIGKPIAINMSFGSRGGVKAIPGLLAFLVGAALLSGPWWSSTLPPSDYPLVIVLGVLFAAIGAFAALPESWLRLRASIFAVFMGAFGMVCAALTFTPIHPAADGTWTIGGIPGFVVDAPMPWWARIAAGFFAIICLGAAVLGVWGMVRAAPGRDDSGL